MTKKSAKTNAENRGDFSTLDLLSTSQKTTLDFENFAISDDLKRDIGLEIEGSKFLQQNEKCVNLAPYIFFIDGGGHGRIVQGCCNDWCCPRCGHIRARTEYGRIVNGAKEISDRDHKLYFHTITCKGRELSLEDAERDYLKWTNRLFSTCRARANKQEMFWCYAQVTERQRRLHPHSHIITSFLPDDAVPMTVRKRGKDGVWRDREVMYSEWWLDKNVSAGLGNQCEITEILNPVAVAVYVSKYLFKDAISTVWPKGWKRVRYSQNWPKLPHEKPDIAFPLVRLQDWHKMESLDIKVYADSEQTLEAAYARLITCVVYKKESGEHHGI